MKDQEIEIKFYIIHPENIEKKLINLGAQCVQPRTLEINLRFDTPDFSLSENGKVLRLRYDTAARMTFKGPTSIEEGSRIRQEIEFIVSDFINAQKLLEALGFQMSQIYEKYRTTFELQGSHITIDELPYGNFIEIEGYDPVHVQEVGQLLALDWHSAVLDSYTVLFDQLRSRLGLGFRDLMFENFVNLKIEASDLGVYPADL